jgi:diguanylate cyclase (GGDEF)-like protein
MFLRSRLRSVFRPKIRSDNDFVAYVARVTILCGVLAVSIDVVNQLTFFVDWESAIRSWVISALVGCGIAGPVSFAIARAHLELYRAKLAVEELSRTDPLTGLLNRRALLDPVDGAPPEVMALVIADIDRFKSVNDTHGHLVGDEVIRMVGRAMQSSLGTYGRIGRIGGEEFALISFSAATERLIGSLWDFRDRIASTPIVVGSASVKVTISVGVASRKDGQNLDDLFAEADRALYLAKASGRNRVVSASGLTASAVPSHAEDRSEAPEPRQYRSAGSDAA